MIDINKTIDVVKLKFMHEWLTTHIYDEGPSPYHEKLTEKVTEDYFDPLELPKNARILDMGCGHGYFLDQLKKRGYTNYLGVTLSPEDIANCKKNGHPVAEYDLTFLPQTQGFTDESVDFIFLRHALEHSPYPLFTLAEYNRVLTQGRRIYIEVPAPDCPREHEKNLNHYSIMGEKMLAALLERTGFNIEKFNIMEFELELKEPDADGNVQKVKEKAFCIVAVKARPLDLK